MSSIQLFNDANLEDLYWDTARIRIVIKLHLLNFKKYSTTSCLDLCGRDIKLSLYYIRGLYEVWTIEHFLNDPTVYFSKINEVLETYLVRLVYQESRRTTIISGKTRLDCTLIYLHVNPPYVFFNNLQDFIQILHRNA